MKGARDAPYDCQISWNRPRAPSCPGRPPGLCARWIKDIGGLRMVKLRGLVRVNSCLGFIAFNLLHLRNALARIDAADLHEAPL